MKKKKIIFWLIWLLKALGSLIILQTLFFKFTGHPQSVELFTSLGLFDAPESVGRISVGIIELTIVMLFLIPRTAIVGSAGVAGLMVGALYFHVTILGFSGENGQLAGMACIALASACIVFVHEYRKMNSTPLS